MNSVNFSNLEAEVNVIGSILLENHSICQVISLLKPEDFYDLRHQLIYKNLKRMYEENMNLDIITLSERLKDKLNDIGGISYLSTIINSMITAGNIKQYAHIVKEKSKCRKLYKMFNNSLSTLSDGDVSSDNLVSHTENSLLNIKGIGGDYGSGSMEVIMERFMDTLQARYEKGGELQGIKSGYKVIDRMLGGLSKEDLIILAARPSMGKTAMAINILLNAAFEENARIAFFNLEMGIRQIIDRAVASFAKIPMNNIKSALLTDDQWRRIAKVSSRLAESPINIYDDIFTLGAIKAECRRLKLQQELDIVIIDYLQLIDSEERAENRHQDISKITRSLKLMAKELDITVIVLSQLSRAPEARADHRPMLSDLRESGSIEQDADVVMFLYRDEYYNRDTDSIGIIECILAKNRNGEVGTVRLRWKGEFQRIENIGGS